MGRVCGVCGALAWDTLVLGLHLLLTVAFGDQKVCRCVTMAWSGGEPSTCHLPGSKSHALFCLL